MNRSAFLKGNGHASRLVTLLGAAAVVAIIVASIASATVLRRDTTSAWRAQLDTLSITLAEHASQTMFAADTVLDSLAGELRGAHIQDEAEFRRAMSDPAYFRLLRDRTEANAFIDVGTIVAANGDVLNYTRGYPHPQINVADRDYFLAHRADSALNAYTSAPVRNRSDGRWVFYMTRRIDNARGEMLGLLMLGISIDTFATFYGKVGASLGEGTVLALYRNDYTLMARWPRRDDLIGQRNTYGAVALVTRDQRADHGVVEMQNPRFADGDSRVSRLAAPRKVARYPLIAVVSIAETGYLRTWTQSLWLIVLSATVRCSFIIWLTWFLARGLRARDRSLEHVALVVHEADSNASAARRARHDAERAVQALRVTQQAAQNASQAKSRFIARLCEMLRPSMNGVITMSDQAIALPGLPEAPRDHLETARNSAAQVLEVVDATVAYTRLEQGGVTLAAAAFDPRELVLHVQAGLSERVRQKGLDARCEIDVGVPPDVLGDRERLRQLLHHLYDNAVKFTEIGWVSIRLAQQNDAQHHAGLCFTIEDSGIGIAPEDEEAMFEPFVQGPRSGFHSGAGLGLALSRQLAALLGARLSLHSKAGLGTRLEIWLPLALATPPAPRLREVASAAPEGSAPAPDTGEGGGVPQSAHASRTAPDSASLNVSGVALNPGGGAGVRAPMMALIAEDHPVHRKQLETLLTAWGHTFHSVSDGFAAVRLFETHRFDYVLMDTQMPFMNGIEAIRSIRAFEREKQYRRTVIIAIAASDMGGDDALCGPNGADACCIKPVVATRLRSCLDAVLESLARHAVTAASA